MCFTLQRVRPSLSLYVQAAAMKKWFLWPKEICPPEAQPYTMHRAAPCDKTCKTYNLYETKIKILQVHILNSSVVVEASPSDNKSIQGHFLTIWKFIKWSRRIKTILVQSRKLNWRPGLKSGIVGQQKMNGRPDFTIWISLSLKQSMVALKQSVNHDEFDELQITLELVLQTWIRTTNMHWKYHILEEYIVNIFVMIIY